MVGELAAQGRDDTGFNRDSGPGLFRSDSWGKCALSPRQVHPHPLSQAEVATGNGNAPGPSQQAKYSNRGAGCGSRHL